MKRSIIFIYSLFLIVLSLHTVVTDTTLVKHEVFSDSLKQSIEQRIIGQYGINDYTTLGKAASIFKLDIVILKQKLGLDQTNKTLDKMTLEQLGVSIYSLLLAQETLQYGFNETSTLLDIAKYYAIPIKKMKHFLDLDPNDRSLNSRSVMSLGLTLQNVVDAHKKFNDNLGRMSNSIILVGMMVVFIALLVTSIVILQLRHLNAKPKAQLPDIKLSSNGTIISANADISDNDIVAVITALHIHTTQLEERRRLVLTFRRGNVNLWHATGFVNMPNRSYQNKRS